MADASGHAPADLNGALPDDATATATGFFELLRQVETDERRFGRAGGPECEPLRLGQGIRLSFATGDIAGLRPGGPDHPPRLDVNVLGLLGPEGPMPLHITRWVMTRLSNRWFSGETADAASDTTFLDFCNLLQHRMIALYWRSWADARPEVQVAHGTGGRVTALMRSLGGVGLPGTMTGPPARASEKLRHGTSLAQQVHGPERLLEYLGDVVGAPVELTEFIGVWTDIPAHLQTRLGRAHAGLGTGAVVGGRVFERQTRAELRIGPLDLEGFTAFLDDTALDRELRHAVVFAVGEEIAFDLRLILAANAVPEARLGLARLGKTTWLNPRTGRDAADFRLRAHIGRTRPAEAA